MCRPTAVDNCIHTACQQAIRNKKRISDYRCFVEFVVVDVVVVVVVVIVIVVVLTAIVSFVVAVAIVWPSSSSYSPLSYRHLLRRVFVVGVSAPSIAVPSLGVVPSSSAVGGEYTAFTAVVDDRPFGCCPSFVLACSLSSPSYLCRCSLFSGDIAWLVQWSRPASVASGPPAVRGLFHQAAVPQCRVAAEAALPSARQSASFPCWLALIPGGAEGGAVTVVVDRHPRHRRRHLRRRSRVAAAILYYFSHPLQPYALPRSYTSHTRRGHRIRLVHRRLRRHGYNIILQSQSTPSSPTMV